MHLLLHPAGCVVNTWIRVPDGNAKRKDAFQKKHPDKQHPKETESKSVKTQIEAQEDILIQQTKPDTLKDDVNVVEVQQPITYKIKRLKRPKVDTEKQQYLFGSDNKLYIFIDEHTAGEEVGQQIEKNGKKMFKFHKK